VGGGRTAPKSFLHPANYIYFDLIVSYLIILNTKFVKLPILWSQISPCRPRKQILLNFFLGLSGRFHQPPAKATSSTPRYLSPPERKYENPSLGERRGGGGFLIYTKNLFARLILFKYATSDSVIFSQIS
jgi:hypothetical protein